MCVWVRNIGGPDLVQNDIQLMQLDVIAPAGPALRNRFRHPGDIITPMAGRRGGGVKGRQCSNNTVSSATDSRDGINR